MSDEKGDARRTFDRERGAAPDTSGDKRRYSPPTIIDYGSIGKLTQGASGAFAESGGMRQHMCL